MIPGTYALLDGSTYIFSLDAQLLFSTLITAINVFAMFFILSYLLFNPARDLLKKRAEKITEERETAKLAMDDALASKAEYEEKLINVNKEVQEILVEARKKGQAQEARIVAEAKEEAARIIERAQSEAQLEKQKVMDEAKTEIIEIASLLAEKVVATRIDTTIDNALVDETLKEIGDQTWLS